MPLKRNLTDTEETVICTQYRDGVTVRELGELMGIAETAIYRTLRDHGIPLRNPQPLQTEQDRNARIIERYNAGESMMSIGKDYGITRQRVHYIITRGH